jgi:hypothetical protein
MLKPILLGVATTALCWVNVPASSQEKKANKVDAKNVPLELVLKSGKDGYALNLGGKTSQQFLADIEAALKVGKPIPQPPAVELEIEVKNTGKEKVDFWASGDPVVMELEVKGPGAKTVQAPLGFTADFRSPNFVSLEPGKSHVFKVSTLRSGFRWASIWHYWTEPGEYTLTARLQTGIRPIPPGVTETFGGARVTLASTPIKVQVK